MKIMDPSMKKRQIMHLDIDYHDLINN